jgi:hypothetical protein
MKKIDELAEKIENINKLDYTNDLESYFKFIRESEDLKGKLKPFQDIQREMQELESVYWMINAMAFGKSKEDHAYMNSTLQHCKQRTRKTLERINGILLNL